MKVLNVVESAFRTLVEEQDDTILWLSQSLEKAGAELSLLLQGNACLYAFIRHALPPLAIGNWEQGKPADISSDIVRLKAAGVPLFVIEEDIGRRGFDRTALQPGISVIPRSQVAGLYDAADIIWHW